MQKDFHYCCLRVLTEKAGFTPDESQIIAFASQYVDDATEHKGMTIENVPEVALPLIQGLKFEPVCTAHKGISYVNHYLKDKSKQASLKVYIPFHFIPSAPYQGSGEYDYRTEANSPFAQQFLSLALDSLHTATSEPKRLAALIKTGIALHTYADTWPHQEFSGRWSPKDNDIEGIALWQEDKWHSLSLLEQMKHNLIPDIGHAEAMNFPDFSHLCWKYEHAQSGIVFERDNKKLLLQAAEAIYLKLCSITNTQPQWEAFSEKLLSCFAAETDSLRKKLTIWREQFPEIEFRYDHETWRLDALKGDRIDWDHFQTAEEFASLRFKATGDLKWFLFHLAAKEQRMRVREQIRQDLL